MDIARDWLDYLEAGGILGSLILTAAAAWFAWRSAGDSQKSAVAAQQTAQAAREEAELSKQMVSRLEEQLEIGRAERAEREQERLRRPQLAAPTLRHMTTFAPGQLTMSVLMRMGIQLRLGRPVASIFPTVVRAEFVNIGDKDADQMLATVAVPASVGLMPSGPAGDHLEEVDLQTSEHLTLVAADQQEPAHQFSWRVAHFPSNQPEAMHVTLLLLRDADYEVELTAKHPEAEEAKSRFIVSPREVRSA